MKKAGVGFFSKHFKGKERLKLYRQYRYRSISLYLILGFTLLFIPIFLVGMLTATSSIQEIRRQREEITIRQLSNQKSQMEVDFKRVLEQQRRFIVSEDITSSFTEKYDTFDAETKVKSIFRLAKSLNMVKNSHPLILNAYLYLPTLTMEIRDNGSYQNNVDFIDEALYEKACQSKKSVFFHNGSLYSSVAFLPSIYFSSPCCVLVEWDTRSFPLYWSLKENGVEYLIFNDQFQIFSDSHSNRGKYMLSSFDNFEVNAKEVIIKECSYEGESYSVALIYSELLECTIASYQPLSVITGPIQKYQLFIWVIGIAGLCAFLGISVMCRRMIKTPLQELMEAFLQVQEGNLDMQIQYKGNYEFSFLIQCFNTMVKRLNRLIQENYAKEIRLKSTQLRQLQVQISPHFLYNSFSIIAHSIHSGDTDSALQMTKALSEYFRYVTQNNQDMETLEKELQFAKAYLEIQEIRFGNRVEVQVEEPDDEMRKLMVPRMIIQPLVENAYKHAFKELEAGGVLSISFKKKKDNFSILVKDNGPGIPEERLQEIRSSLLEKEPTGHNGLFNVYQRLWLQYEKKDVLQLMNTEQGLCVEICIPLEEK